MFDTYNSNYFAGLVVAVLVLYVWIFVTTIVFAQKGGFSGLESQPSFGAIASAPSMRFQPRTDTGSTSSLALGGGGSCDCSSSFLGGSEPPVFYDIGDIGATRASIAGTMGKAHGKGWDVTTGQSADQRHGKSGFASLDERLLAMQ